MNKTRITIVLSVVLVAGLWASAEFRIQAKGNGGVGPDVIVGNLTSIIRWGTLNGETSFSVGTTSCNVGSSRLSWIASTPAHPVIPQNLYRVKDGRIEHIGNSWLKHGYGVAAGNFCDTCTDPAGTYLGVGCSDPYTAGLNGSQGGLGPKSEVNASTGEFPMPYRNLTGEQRGTLGGRVRVLNTDIDPSLNSEARYFVESHYVHPEDAASGNGLNNASYREVFASGTGGTFNVTTRSTHQTIRQEPGISAWKAVHPDVQIFNVDVPGDGRIIVGMRYVENHIELAIQNFNSHRSVRSLKATFDSSEISNPGFSDVDYQFESYSDADWNVSIDGNEIEWSTDSFATNENANAIRWNTLYSFWADADECPSQLTLGMFRPGEQSEFTIELCQTLAVESFEVTRGTYFAGDVASLATSDDVDLSARRATQDVQSLAEFEFNGFSPFASPGSLDVTLESSVFARTQVVQTIELFDFDSQSWEEVDSRDAARFSDVTVNARADGDLSRFVEPGVLTVRARVSYRSTNPRQRFSCNNDVFTWSVGR